MTHYVYQEKGEKMEGKKMNHQHMNHGNNAYLRLAAMIALSFISMYILMFAMANSFANVYSSFNQFYMAGLMTAPMVIIELALMGAMYKNKKMNRLIFIGSAVALVGFWTGIRQQVGISDGQFFRSMIPHHAGAILMCEQSPAQSPQIKELCKNIITSQQAEIAQMKALLAGDQK